MGDSFYCSCQAVFTLPRISTDGPLIPPDLTGRITQHSLHTRHTTVTRCRPHYSNTSQIQDRPGILIALTWDSQKSCIQYRRISIIHPSYQPSLKMHYTKVCGHPFKLVDLAISVTPVADRCIKSSTLQCNLHSKYCQ